MVTKTTACRRKAHWLGGISLIGLWVVTTPAIAQEEPSADEAVSEVVITGSRTIRDGSAAPTPVAVLSAEQLQNASPRNLAEGLANLPALRGSTGTNTGGTGASRNYVGSFMNLRSQGVSRTLTLLDGRRFTPSSVDGGVNFNNLPQSLIKRVDIVTGGASAAYGSDAMTGVVNVILDTEFTGVKGLVQGGISDKGDVGNYKAELSWGARLLDDRLHLLATYGINHSNGLYSLAQRKFARRGNYRLVTTQPPSPTIGLNAENVRFSQYPGGLILSGGNNPLVNSVFGVAAKSATVVGGGYKFLNDGNGGIVGSPYSLGSIQTSQYQIGGDGVQYLMGAASLLEDDNGFGRATFDLTDKTQIFIESAFGKSHNIYGSIGNYILYTGTSTALASGGNAFTIYEDNPYLQDLAKDAYARLTSITPGAIIGGTAVTTAAYNSFIADCQTLAETTTPQGRCFRMGLGEGDLPQAKADVTTRTGNMVLGFKTEIFGYRLSGYHQRGNSDTFIHSPGNIYYEKLYAAADVIRNPAVGGLAGVATGAPVCRVLVTGTAAQKALFNGCQPMNLFGAGNKSQASLDYAFVDPGFGYGLRQNVTALDIAGEPFELPAGPLSVAVGVEHRELSVYQDGEPLFPKAANGVRGFPAVLSGAIGTTASINQESYSGVSKVDEAYTELNIPLLKDMFLAQELSLNAAGRYTDYSLSGPVKTWKVGVSYRPVESFRFRGTLSRDIRAPSVGELFQGNATSGTDIIDTIIVPPNTVANGATRIRAINRGNPALDPEIADTKTIGVVFTPSWIEGFTASIDYFDISISDAILNPTAQNVVDQCQAGNQVSCSYIFRSANTTVQFVATPFQNLQLAQTTGVDVEASYRWEFPLIPGRFNARTLLGYIGKQSTTAPGGKPISTAGEVASSAVNASSNPRMRVTTQVGYENGPFAIDLINRYTSHARSINALTEGVNIDINRVGSYTVWDVSARYKFGADENLEAFFVVNNLMDEVPPRYSSYSLVFSTNVTLYDTIGRSYVTGVKFRF